MLTVIFIEQLWLHLWPIMFITVTVIIQHVFTVFEIRGERCTAGAGMCMLIGVICGIASVVGYSMNRLALNIIMWDEGSPDFDNIADTLHRNYGLGPTQMLCYGWTLVVTQPPTYSAPRRKALRVVIGLVAYVLGPLAFVWKCTHLPENLTDSDIAILICQFVVTIIPWLDAINTIRYFHSVYQNVLINRDNEPLSSNGAPVLS